MKTAVTHQAPASPALSAGVFFRRAGTTRNQNLPGMGGVYNLVNLHVYHYAGNNPVKYIDPDGRRDIDGKEEKVREMLYESSKGISGAYSLVLQKSKNT